MIFWQIAALLEKYEATLKTPVRELPDDAIDEILYGSDERIKIKAPLSVRLPTTLSLLREW